VAENILQDGATTRFAASPSATLAPSALSALYSATTADVVAATAALCALYIHG